jgi:hypothetical protein
LLCFPPTTGAARNPLRAALYHQQKDSTEAIYDSHLLEPNVPIKRELAGGEEHSYILALYTGQYVPAVVNQQYQSQDGFLYAHEVFNLNIPTELIELIGRRTGLSKDIKAEGLSYV